MKCLICKKPTQRGFREGGKRWGPYQKTCSEVCRKKRNIQVIKLAHRGIEKNKVSIFKQRSLRMKTNNPMFDSSVRVKMVSTLKRNGIRPKVRGGNGQEMPVPQRILLSALGSGWCAEHAVSTFQKISSGYPPCYKIDIAHPKNKIGIEIDGPSHASFKIKERDLKKQKLLIQMGWKIYRFKNKDVMDDLKNILSLLR